MELPSPHSLFEKKFNEAITSHQQGNLEQACLLYLELTDTFPDSPVVNFNFGLALFELGHYEESCVFYCKALKAVPDEIDILYNLALSYKHLGHFDKTIRTYKKILNSNPTDRDSMYNLACCYTDIREDDQAMSYYRKTLELDPNNQGALSNLAYVFHRNEEYEQASKYYARLLRLQPDHPSAQHMLASLQGNSRETPPLQYVREIFDNYSRRYDNSLVTELEYAVPQKMRQVFEQLYSPFKDSLNGLDLGCGTGLSGQTFSSVCAKLTGIDISSKMIEVAAGKTIYTALHVSEIQEFINNCTGQYSLILAADVFGYIGALEELFVSLAKITRPGAHFCFSTENLDMGDYSLRKSGRFAHSLEYIRNICTISGWKLDKFVSVNLRREKSGWIDGNLYFTIRQEPL